MASEGSTELILKRRRDEVARMPPPPTKKIKQPAEILDEDEYTEALSDIIARDYYPGLREAKAQEQYLQALDSKNAQWIIQAERELRLAREGEEPATKPRRKTRDSRYDTPRSYQQAADTPKASSVADTPVTVASTELEHEEKQNPEIGITGHTVSSYQGKHTSEDNDSFNTLVDKQNEKRRNKYAHLWTADQRIPSQRLMAQRLHEQQLLKDKEEYRDVNGRDLIPLSSGAVDTRPAKPSSWKVTNPANTFMFSPPTSIDEQGLPTIQDRKEAMSRAGPKAIVHENTRFPPTGPRWHTEDDDDATSIHTSFIARRNAAGTDIGTETGAETPRVNGYGFVDDEDPPVVDQTRPTYRDLLAGQAVDDSANPFKLKGTRSREDLHLRLVEREAEKKRSRQKETMAGRSKSQLANMTPAARQMMARLGGRTPGVSNDASQSRREDWTPVATPRRSRTAAQ